VLVHRSQATSRSLPPIADTRGEAPLWDTNRINELQRMVWGLGQKGNERGNWPRPTIEDRSFGIRGSEVRILSPRPIKPIGYRM